ncbi:hypothetical protein S1361_35825 [Streptomyces cyanogenus]|uniref:Uncharacterized protein n=1 Tax=Streptomyces cyanogenus TaxID=80860 RepID=A0ABX7U1V7_STRCY|nr:hypothetical protein S1361_35825 [Streptomyces cyanogenus]
MPHLSQAAVTRPYRPADRDAVAGVCVRTAHEGGDSRAIHPDQRLMPSLFAEPYCRFDPDLAFVPDDGTGRAVECIVGTADTERFVEDFRRDWIPRPADRCPEPAGPPRTPTEEMIRLLHHPERMLVPELAGYPAHPHTDLLPARQARGQQGLRPGRGSAWRVRTRAASPRAPGCPCHRGAARPGRRAC